MNYYELIQKSIDNQKRKTNCEKMLGTNTAVNKFASFYDQNFDNLQIVAMARQLEFMNDPRNHIEDLPAYTKGIADMIKMFVDCYTEREKNREEAEKNRNLDTQTSI